MFKEFLILSFRERHGTSRRCAINGLELKYYLQKKKITEDEAPKEIDEVSRT